jgi:hypothetical protein
MADGTPSPIPTERQSHRFRGDEASRAERSAGPREGGFRIRLSDNEMRSARALQEAFGLRSTVAVLGFALRTLGQQLEEGKLEELAAQHRAQTGSRSGSGAGSGQPEGRRERPEGGRSPGERWQEGGGAGGRGGVKVDPFARPSRPAQAPEPVEEPAAEEPLQDLSIESSDIPPSETPATPSEPVAELVAEPAPETAAVLPSATESTDPQPANASSEEPSQTAEE